MFSFRKASSTCNFYLVQINYCNLMFSISRCQHFNTVHCIASFLGKGSIIRTIVLTVSWADLTTLHTKFRFLGMAKNPMNTNWPQSSGYQRTGRVKNRIAYFLSQTVMIHLTCIWACRTVSRCCNQGKNDLTPKKYE